MGRTGAGGGAREAFVSTTWSRSGSGAFGGVSSHMLLMVAEACGGTVNDGRGEAARSGCMARASWEPSGVALGLGVHCSALIPCVDELVVLVFLPKKLVIAPEPFVADCTGS